MPVKEAGEKVDGMMSGFQYFVYVSVGWMYLLTLLSQYGSVNAANTNVFKYFREYCCKAAVDFLPV